MLLPNSNCLAKLFTFQTELSNDLDTYETMFHRLRGLGERTQTKPQTNLIKHYTMVSPMNNSSQIIVNHSKSFDMPENIKYMTSVQDGIKLRKRISFSTC